MLDEIFTHPVPLLRECGRWFVECGAELQTAVDAREEELAQGAAARGAPEEDGED